MTVLSNRLNIEFAILSAETVVIASVEFTLIATTDRFLNFLMHAAMLLVNNSTSSIIVFLSFENNSLKNIFLSLV